MSTLKADTLQAKTTNGTLTLANNGTGKVELPADATIGGVAMTTIFASGATTAEKSNIMLNSFRIEEQGGLTVQGMVDGVSDVFTDESGVDTATSTDETYNAAGDYYENPGDVIVTSASWTGSTANFTLTPDGHWFCSNAAGNFGVYLTDEIVGDFDLSWTWTTYGSTSSSTGLEVTFFPSTALGSWSATSGVAGGLTSTNHKAGIRNAVNTTIAYGDGASEATLTTITSGQVCRFTRTGSTFQFYVGATLGTVSLVRTFTATSSANGYICFAQNTPNGAFDVVDDITFAQTVLNSVIVSETFTALSQPDTAFVAIWHEDVDACTPNTDFTVEASRDAGTTWTAGTLALATTLSTQEILTCSVDISGQPAGTSMRWRVKFFNALSQRLRGVGLQWS
jgi:hypothetical protein